MINDSNRVILTGVVTSQPEYSHEVYGEKFYGFTLRVKRLSGADDLLPILLSDRLVDIESVQTGKRYRIAGQLRSGNRVIDGASRLLLAVFVMDICETTDDEGDENDIELGGFICKQPIYRVTPFGREIADILVAVNRAYHKSDYIPCIAWGRNARFADRLGVGSAIRLKGRVQSRVYEKLLPDGSIQKRTAYEVSASKIMKDTVEKRSGANS